MASQAVFLSARALVGLGRRLDDLLYPRYATQSIDQPVFIYAAPRSGTTLLHRLLSCDTGRFTHVRLYETVLQSIALTRAVECVATLDRPLGGVLKRTVERADAWFFGAWENIHPMGLNRAEEDEAYFIFSLLSPGLLVFYPWVEELERVAWLDQVEDATRQRVMAEYKGGIQRYLFASGRGRTWLNKSAILSNRINSMNEAFPDARYIHLVRTPYETVPSFISMFTRYWSIFFPELPRSDRAMRSLAELAIQYTRRGLAFRDVVGPERFCCIRYVDLVADPRAVVEHVYRHFGWTLGEDFSRRLHDEAVMARKYQPRHAYSLDDYGLTKQEIYSALRDVFDEFGFDPALA